MTAVADTPAATAPPRPERPSGVAQAAVLILLLLVCAGVGYAARMVTEPALDVFYGDLAKPWWTPPDIAFPIAWGVLYALMAVAAWQAWRVMPKYGGGALWPFFIQLALNAAWPFAFFYLGNVSLAFVVVLALLLAILGTMAAFAQRSALAAWLMVPYLLWVGYATALNAMIVELNV